MILRLVREQLRSHGRFVAWTAALLSVAMGLATFTLTSIATSLSTGTATADIWPWSREHQAQIASIDDAAPPPPKAYSFDEQMPADDVEALLDEIAGMPGVSVERHFGAEFATTNPNPGSGSLDLGAFRTPVAWDDYLVSGVPPTQGEVVVRADVAAALGIETGDPLELHSQATWRADVRTMTFVVSGLARQSPGDLLGTDYQMPSAVMSWQDSFEAQRRLGGSGPWIMPDGTSPYTGVIIGWDGNNPTLAPYEDPYSHSGKWALGINDMSFSLGAHGFPVPVAVSGAIILGLLGAALGMGRAQSQIRTEWIATARVLGATRRSILASSVLEALVVGSAGLLVGLGGGLLGAFASQEYRRAANPEAYIVHSLSVPGIVPLAVAALSFAIAAILASVPAFWAARVSPVAALKPVAPATTAPISRSVTRWWPAGIAVAGVVMALVGYHLDQYNYHEWAAYSPYAGALPARLMWRLGVPIAAIAGFALLFDLLRSLIARLATRIARIPRAWAVAACDGLTAHARLHIYAAASFAAMVGFVTSTMSSAATTAVDSRPFDGHERPYLIPLKLYLAGAVEWNIWYRMLVPALIVAAIIAIGVTFSSRRVLAADSATRSALGLSGRSAQVAAAIGQGAPMLLGIAVGALVGWLLPLVVRLAEALASGLVPVNSASWNLQVAGYGLVATCYAVVPAVVIALASSLVVGLAEGRGTPVEARRKAAGVRS